jgi:hypothetical protein
MPYTHRGEPLAGNRLDNRRLLAEAVDRIRAYTGLSAANKYAQTRIRKNMGLFNTTNKE